MSIWLVLFQWEAYTLGQAAETPDGRHDLTNVQEAAISSNVDIARAAGHRYLVQRWGDGTVCDRTGEPREIEVQVCYFPFSLLDNRSRVRLNLVFSPLSIPSFPSSFTVL